MMISMMAPKTTSACFQPNPPMKPTASGENRNWPNEPAAVPAPKASDRICGGISLLKAAITIVNDAPGNADADEHAGGQVKCRQVVVCAISASPAQ